MAAALAVLGVAIGVARRRLGRADAVSVFVPLVLFALWAVPYAPALVDDLPLTLMLAGPFRWWIAAAAIGWAALRWLDLRPVGVDGAWARPRTIFVIGLFVYLGAGALVHRAQGLGGDEPHYLIITHSLWADADLRIENNHAQGDYAAFYGGELRPDFLERGRDGAVYSVHAPGLGILLLPAYALAGASGAIAFMAILAALGGLGVFRIARAFVAPAAAVFVWAAVCLSTPYLLHAWLLYPEMPAAAIVAWTLVWILEARRAHVAIWLARGLLLGALPWLHTKFVTLGLLGLVLLWQSAARREWTGTAALAGGAGAMLAAWLTAYYVMYGVWDPTIAYGTAAIDGYQLSWHNLPRGLLGLLLDQEYGLIWYAPIYALAPVGIWMMFKRPPAHLPSPTVLAAAALAGAVFVAATTRYYMWWGGSSVPARFLVPVLPLVVPFLAMAVAAWRQGAAGGLPRVLLVVSGLVALTLLWEPEYRLMYNDRDGSGRMLEFLDSSGVLNAVLPSFLLEDWWGPLRQTVLLAGVFVAAFLARRWLAGRDASTTTRVLLGTSVIVVVSLGVRLLTPTPAYVDMVQKGRLALLHALDPLRLHAVDLTRLDFLSPPQTLSLSTLRFRAPTGATPVPSRALGPLYLPPGTYDATVRFRDDQAARGDVSLVMNRFNVSIARTTVASHTEARVAFTLADRFVPPLLWLSVDQPPQAAALAGLDLEPRAIAPRSTRSLERAVAVEPLDETSGAYLAYLSPGIDPEGGAFWTPGRGVAHLVLVPGGTSRVRLSVEAGPVGGIATVQVGGAPARSMRLEPGQGRAWTETLDTGQASVPIRAGCSASFRPADFDEASSDRRSLGCRVTVRLPVDSSQS